MRTGHQRHGVRASALWGSGKRGEGSRSNALWGSGKRRTALLATLTMFLLVPLTAMAQNNPAQAYVTPTLLTAAQGGSTTAFDVIVQGRGGNQAAKAVASALGADKKAYKDFRSIDGIAVQLSGAQIVALASDKRITAITPDARVRLSGTSLSSQLWPYVSGTAWYGNSPAATIAIVDSGIDASRPEFAGRIAANVNLSTLSGNSSGDGRGHGTFVAGIAAGRLAGLDGAAPNAKIVSLDVMDDKGMARTSDVIAAADWILANKAQYGIKVANFSLHSSVANSFMYDPLDKAVERLWFGGVTVVAAAGNYGSADGPSGVPFAPGNDPFVITVGAADTATWLSTSDDFMAPWSAYGYTLDGFAKPELAAPGRFMIGPVPTTATLYSERADHVVDTGYMELSGTSFAAPVVSGTAALLLGRYPNLTPDQVKGALMVGALRLPRAAPLSAGVGEVNAPRSFSFGANPPAANRALAAFVGTDPVTGAPVFDAASWASTAKANASWASASWADASWASASWADASWAAASWADLSLGSASWADNAETETADLTGGGIAPSELDGVLKGTLTP